MTEVRKMLDHKLLNKFDGSWTPTLENLSALQSGIGFIARARSRG